MSNGIVSLFFALGSGAWVYNKFMRYNGNNTKQAAIATVVAAGVVFFIVFSLLSLIVK